MAGVTIFRIIYLDKAPMQIKGKAMMAAVAITDAQSISPGHYRGLVSGNTVAVINASGHVKLVSGSISGGRAFPLTIDAEQSDDIDINELFGNQDQLRQVNNVLSQTVPELPFDCWIAAQVKDTHNFYGTGWLHRTVAGTVLQIATTKGHDLMPPYFVSFALNGVTQTLDQVELA